jgi:hypothetical protein
MRYLPAHSPISLAPEYRNEAVPIPLIALAPAINTAALGGTIALTPFYVPVLLRVCWSVDRTWGGRSVAEAAPFVPEPHLCRDASGAAHIARVEECCCAAGLRVSATAFGRAEFAPQDVALKIAGHLRKTSHLPTLHKSKDGPPASESGRRFIICKLRTPIAL